MRQAEYKNLNEILDTIKSNRLVVLIGSTKACGVCEAIKPRMEELLGKYSDIKEIYVYVDEVKEAAGEFMIFTVPTIIMFAEGKEVHKESRIIDFKRLEFELSRWSEFFGEIDS
ncbi:MAG TPA: thioredoxin family protein [Epulopiscium sp.]|nr:thioredoxin family protein [Candidatus Epulonipiscium sp.]